MIWPSRNDWGLVFYGGPLAHILVKKNIMISKKIQLMRDYFINEFGVFKIDSETQYHFNKQAIFFYNAHDTRFSKKLAKKINKLYAKHKDEQILELLKANFKELENTQDIFEAFEKIIEGTNHYPIDLDTDKYLPFFTARKPKGTKLLMEFANQGRKAIETLYPSILPKMPIIVVMVGVLIFFLIYKDIPEWIRQIQRFMGVG